MVEARQQPAAHRHCRYIADRDRGVRGDAQLVGLLRGMTFSADGTQTITDDAVAIDPTGTATVEDLGLSATPQTTVGSPAGSGGPGCRRTCAPAWWGEY